MENKTIKEALIILLELQFYKRLNEHGGYFERRDEALCKLHELLHELGVPIENYYKHYEPKQRR